MKGAYGIVPPAAAGNWAVPTAASYTTVKFTGLSTDLEAYLCFKCHAGPGTPLGSVTTTSGTYTRTDLGQEFNTNNFSSHNVLGMAKGVNRNANASNQYIYTDVGGTVRTQTWQFPTSNVFRTGWTQDSKVTCSDCHTGGSATQAKGPHGSTTRFLIDPTFSTDWKTVTYTNRASATFLCNKCHSVGSSNSAHSQGDHSNYLCVRCHIAIPHGWKRPRLLLSTARGDAAPYLASGQTASNSLNGIISTANHTGTTSITWSKANCSASCSSGDHPAVTTSVMP